MKAEDATKLVRYSNLTIEGTANVIHEAERRIGSYIVGGGKSDDGYVTGQKNLIIALYKKLMVMLNEDVSVGDLHPEVCEGCADFNKCHINKRSE